ncbi:related to DUR1,2-urea amidolyase [Rhynchosporium graminicola]|uniref:Related to DUR1,2-urea amidolyase n=1 Tax=Rhynchosporium graminicola TaxID=2792576 RepID=A0A1E1JXE9_9HELO|nr:related to DUR1,2-urea amidolyase [Rhynchosporium commune]
MVLELQPALPSDSDRIATIHLLAFDSNPLLHAQFPTPASLTALHSILRQETLHAIQNTKDTNAILIVKDTNLEKQEQIIAFAKWDLPTGKKVVLHERVTWPDFCRREWLDGYHELAEAAKERVMGSAKCYRLTFVGTLPKHQGRGAGTLLSKWGVQKAKDDNLPVYLESTIAASPLYRRLGFVALDGLSMVLPGNGPDGGPNIYEEIGMLKTPEGSDMDRWDSSLNISSLVLDYEAGIKPQHVIQAVYDRIEAYKAIQPSVWIHLQPFGEAMRAAMEISIKWPDSDKRPPLWGVPFSVKDSINIAGIQTTTGCPALAFTPTESAPVSQHCINAGGLFIGKTNMEQLATGMTGCRSAFGTLHSTFSKAHCVGGSSSGSAVSVSAGLVSFSLGSDTAGSIRVPALFNGVVGFKPTKGTVSARGVSPASLHQDCVSFLTTDVLDAERVWNVCKGFDKSDVFAKLPSQMQTSRLDPGKQQRSLKFRFGVPPPSALEICSPIYRKIFLQVIEALQNNGGESVDLDWEPFERANELLYNSSFVEERLTMFPEGWLDENKQKLHPVTRQVFEAIQARKGTAVNLFRDLHKQAEYVREVQDILTLKEVEEGVDEITLIIVPTTPFHPMIKEVEEDPIAINGRLGSFAHFGNVLDLVGVAIPCGRYESHVLNEAGKKVELLFGVTVLTGMGFDGELLKLVGEWEEWFDDIGSVDGGSRE